MAEEREAERLRKPTTPLALVMELISPQKHSFEVKGGDENLKIKWIIFILLLLPLIFYTILNLVPLKSDVHENWRVAMETQRAQVNREKEFHIQAFEVDKTRFNSQIAHLVEAFNKKS
jgi:hypothetical protein